MSQGHLRVAPIPTIATSVTLALALTIAGCSGNGEPTDAVIVTTTSVAAEAGASVPTTESNGSSAESTVPGTATVEGSTIPAPSSPSSSPSPSSSATPSSSPTPSSSAMPSGDEIDLNATTMTTRTVGSFVDPVGLAIRPNDPTLYIIEQAGRIVAVETTGDNPRTVLDISPLTNGDGERGLLGLAFHPSEPLAYIDYTDVDGNTVVAEYRVGDDATFDPASQRIVWQLAQPYSNHNGGDLNFGPDNMLYVAVGDGGSGGDPERRASDPTTKFGSIVRIDPTGRADGEYSIPPDNPFGNEVWAYGLRNPWKFNFDPANGDLWIADVGQNAFEEVDHVPSIDGAPAGRGANFGWSAYEATTRFNDDVAEPDNMVLPVMYYEHSGGNCSISGSANIATWYVYGDYCTGKLWGFTLGSNGAAARNVNLGEGFDQLAAVRNGPDGSIFTVQRGGAVTELIFE